MIALARVLVGVYAFLKISSHISHGQKINCQFRTSKLIVNLSKSYDIIHTGM